MSNETTITVTFIRHGESTDNIRSVWAGWADAPLSNHGMNQARAMGQSLADTHITTIYASPLKRAFSTAEVLRDAQSKRPEINVSPLIREQHFGIAEGKPFTFHMAPGKTAEEYWAEGVYPVQRDRHAKFPGGESSDDLAGRANQAVEEIILPVVWETARSGEQGVHIALVSHGLCIGELVSALIRKTQLGEPTQSYEGLMNTVWTRAVIFVKGSTEGQPLRFSDQEMPVLQVQITDVNRHEHIDGIVRTSLMHNEFMGDTFTLQKRQKGGIGSSAYDPGQQDIRAFFGGGGVKKPVEAHLTESNAEGEEATRSV